MRMSEQEEKGLVPVLRFPEFRDAGGWKNTQLGKIGDFTGGGTPSKSNDAYWQGNIPWVSSSDIYEDSIHEFNISRYITEEALNDSATKLVPENSILLVSRVGVGKLAVSKSSVCTSQDFTSFTPVKDDLVFFGYYLKSRTKALLEHSQGMAIKGFTKDDVSKLDVHVPSLKEQQKIADCLISVDDLITAQTQKLDTLKTHKKGLMQQLFPAEGETVPKLRFPEFRDKGEWQTKSLIDIATGGFSNGVFNDPEKVGHGYKLINVLDMYIETPINESALSLVGISESEFLKNKVEPNDIFFTRSSLVKAGIAQSNIYLGCADDITFDGHLIRLRPDQNVIAPMFLHYALKSSFVRSQLIAKGKTATMTTIGQADIASTKLPIPLLIDEQQKIADCLASVDDLITAQTQKLATLKAHKNGLMQQLFPAMDEVSA